MGEWKKTSCVLCPKNCGLEEESGKEEGHKKRVGPIRPTLRVFWRKCMGIEPTWEGISPPHWI